MHKGNIVRLVYTHHNAVEHYNQAARYSTDFCFLCESKNHNTKGGNLAYDSGITYSCATAHDFHMIPLFLPLERQPKIVNLLQGKHKNAKSL